MEFPILLVLISSIFLPSSAQILDGFNATTGPPSSAQIEDSMVSAFFDFPGEASVDPSLQSWPKKLGYDDGSGTYIGSDEVHRYASGVKCWSDYFVVNEGYWYGPWRKASGNIYCTGTSECSLARMDGVQTCESWSISISAGIQNQIVSFGIQTGFGEERCNSGQDTSQCTWSDGKCHCIWTQQQMVYQNGYKRRRCSSRNGDYTAWMQDFVHDAPTRRVSYGCGSQCSDSFSL